MHEVEPVAGQGQELRSIIIDDILSDTGSVESLQALMQILIYGK
jgi:hypothetical protein